MNVVVWFATRAMPLIKVEVQNLHDMYLEECHIRLNTACLNPSCTHRKDWHLNRAIINNTTLLSHNTGIPIFDRGVFRFVFLWQARYLTKEYLLNDCMKRLVQCQFWIKHKRQTNNLTEEVLNPTHSE